MGNHNHTPIESPELIAVSETAEKMTQACIRLLEALTHEGRRKCMFDFFDLERLRWHYVPREMFDRKGLCLQEMKTQQRRAALNLLACGLSRMGFERAKAIMNLENILGEVEQSHGIARFVRDPGLYYFSVFGDPTHSTPWGWRAEGHHVSLNFTVVSRDRIAPNPFFFGANPAEVRSGPHKGLRILANEETLARSLLKSLDIHQQQKTVISNVAPADILTRDTPKVEFERAEGLAAESMTPAQRKILDQLIHAYIDRLPEALATIELKKVHEADLNDIHFAWAGAGDPGKPHYYRLHGPFFLVEYDNTQNNANHIHSVWRHVDDDFGLDLLKMHYRQGHK